VESIATEKMDTMMEMMMNQMGTNNPNDVVDNILSGRWGFRKERRWMVSKKWAEFLASATKLTVTDDCKYLEKTSNVGYFSGYKPGNIKSISEQVNCLRKYFPELRGADEAWSEEYLPRLPIGDIEGWFASPRWEKIAPTYQEALNRMLDTLKSVMGDGFLDYRHDPIWTKHPYGEYLGQTKKTIKSLEELRYQQKNHDILIYPAQFGFRHRNRGIRRVWAVMNDFEFGLDAFTVGAMLLTHPERLKHCKDLGIDCAGSIYESSYSYNSSHFFFCNCTGVNYYACDAAMSSLHSGSATGWVISPQEIARRTRIKQGMLKP